MSEEEFAQKYISQGIVLPERKKRLGYKIPMDEHGNDVVEEEISDTSAFEIPVDELPEYKNWFEEGYVTRPHDQG